jgi:hypothetical protein
MISLQNGGAIVMRREASSMHAPRWTVGMEFAEQRQLLLWCR